MRNKKLLYISDSEATPSGYGRVSKNLLHYFKKAGFEITFLGIGVKVDNPKGYSFYHTDFRDQRKMINDFNTLALSFKPDIVFFNLDYTQFLELIRSIYNYKVNAIHPVKFIGYTPIDSPFWPLIWYTQLSLFDKVFIYTKKGVELAKPFVPAFKINQLYHGVDLKIFKPEKEKKKEFRKKLNFDEDTFIILNVARNQVRKDIPTSMLIIKNLIKKLADNNINKKVLYYIHALSDESTGLGWNLLNVAAHLHIQEHVRFLNPKIKYSDQMMNEIYNAADIFLSTTLNEGYGLFVNECFATKTPLFISEVYPMKELLDDGNRGVLLPTLEQPFFPIKRFDLPSFLVNAKKAADIIYDYITNEDKQKELNKKVENAYNFVKKLDWKYIANELINEFNKPSEVGILM